MGTKFTSSLNRFFGSEDGAYSVVTVRESVNDSQITVTGHEKVLLIERAGEILRGSVKDIRNSGRSSEKSFRLYPSGKRVSLNLIFPKPIKDELRLYLKNDEFRPAPSLIWFTFIKDDDLWIGAMDNDNFQAADTGTSNHDPRPAFFDINDTVFQEAIYAPPPENSAQEKLVNRIRRNPQIARAVLHKSGYSCELRPDLPTFTSRVGDHPYLEAHHLVPLGLQPQFPNVNLDIEENIAILNPWSHRMLHHGLLNDIKPHLVLLAKSRNKLLNKLDIDINNIYEMYGPAGQ